MLFRSDGDSYRSPWSGEFEPALEQSSEGGVDEGAGAGAVPSDRVRKMEIRANEAFDVYRELYYEGGLSSVYFWNLDDGFAGVVLLKKGMLIAGSTGFLGRRRVHKMQTAGKKLGGTGTWLMV